MTTASASHDNYFPFDLAMSGRMWRRLELDEALHTGPGGGRLPRATFSRLVAGRLNRLPGQQPPVPAGEINLYALFSRICRHLVMRYTEVDQPHVLQGAIAGRLNELPVDALEATVAAFVGLYPPEQVLGGDVDSAGYITADGEDRQRRKTVLRELLLLRVAAENPALDNFRILFADIELQTSSPYRRVLEAIEAQFRALPPVEPLSLSLPDLLRAPIKASPHSLAGQMEFVKEHWHAILPPELLTEILTAIDILREEELQWFGGPGKPQVLEFPAKGKLGRGGDDYPEYERFSADADWMSNVVMIAKMVYVWLGQLEKQYGRPVHRLDQIPDEELDRLARWGFSALWLIGLWERSPASQKVKQLCGNPDAISSAYSLFDYAIAADLGGEVALANLKHRCQERGIRLASDMVPNHTGIYSKWTVEHPDWFVQLDYPPYPSYSFTGPDLSFDSRVTIQLEDGYWDKRDAAVVFRHVDNGSGQVRYIYHGNDGTSTPWNDTAQLNYLIPAVREAVIQTILHVAHQFPVIRFDAAMTLAKKHFQRLWYPQPGHGSGVPSRAEHGMERQAFDQVFPEEFWREVVDRVAVEAPDTLLLAEAFWLMEGYFVRTLGMHRVYNSAFMNMLKLEENAKYRQTIKNVLEFNPEILKRFVNFMNNPDERTAIEQFGREGKYFGAAVLLVTMPGLPMFGHGQIEGFHEKYGMEYRRAYWDEPVDEHLVAMHEEKIFPLMRRRYLFSGSENFIFYDFFAGSQVDENVFAYSNRVGDERGIIVYHNSYAETSGWIRTSTSRPAVIDSGETVLVQTTLGEALGFKGDSLCYYRFRDYASRLEYLCSGRELCEKGLQVRMEAYQYHAFLDFIEIMDDEFGSWGRLCHFLQGRAVADLDEELAVIRHAPVIDCFVAATRDTARWLELLVDQSTPEKQMSQARESCRGGVKKFFTLLLEHGAGCQEYLEHALEAAGESFEAADALWTWVSAEPAGAAESLAGKLLKDSSGRALLASYLVLHATGNLEEGRGVPAHSAAWLMEFGLMRGLVEFFNALSPVPESSAPPALLAKLAGLLVQEQHFFSEVMNGGVESFQRFLEKQSVATFLRIHSSEGTEWFVKERSELCFTWLWLCAVVESLCHPEKDILSSARLYRALVQMLGAAEHSGYAVDMFAAEIGKIVPRVQSVQPDVQNLGADH